MLKIFRNHSETCPFIDKGREYTKCSCVIWYDWALDPDTGRRRRGSLETRDWRAAQKMAQDMEISGGVIVDHRITIEKATGDWQKDAAARKLKRATLKKLRVLADQVNAFAQKTGMMHIHEWDAVRVREFRQGWADGDQAALKKFERLGSFFRFCVSNEWLKKSPCADVQAPKVRRVQVQPFNRSEMTRIYAAAEQMQESRRVKAFVLLLRYSGLRVDDVVTMRRTDIDHDGMLRKWTKKKDIEVLIPLPPEVVMALDGFEHVSAEYPFWTGDSNEETRTGNYRRTLSRLFEIAGFEGHAHRFRHTFAVELLQTGATTEQVARLLGHQDIRITQRYYSAWIKERQDQAEAAVRRTWDTVPVPRKQAGGEVVDARQNKRKTGV